jgi:carbon monoxide dehydrogenase subunit G
MKLESKVGKINSPDERIYNFLTNFNNFKNLIPEGKVEDWISDENTCQFTMNPLGKTGVRILEKEPYKLIKLANLEESKFNFFFWVQLKPDSEFSSDIKLSMEVQLNPMLEMMAKKPLQEFLDKLVDQLARYSF